MATLSLKKSVEVDFNRVPTRKTAKVIDFTGIKPTARTLLHTPKPKKVSFEELFGFKPKTTGEHIAIIRAWMSKRGYHAVPEAFTITGFASAMQWEMRERCHWEHFCPWHESRARVFLKEQAELMLKDLLRAEAA